MWEFTSLKNDIRGKARENEALNKSFESHRQELISRFVADYMKEYKEDLERVVMAMQSRIRTLQSEKIGEYMDAKRERNEY